jgi:hypothetical protein
MRERSWLALREGDAAFRKDYFDVQRRARKALAESAMASKRSKWLISRLVSDCTTETTTLVKVFHSLVLLGAMKCNDLS